jgi:hypothetical protein
MTPMTPEDKAILEGVQKAMARFLEWIKTSESYRAQVSDKDLSMLLDAMMNKSSIGQKTINTLAELREESGPLFHAILGSIVCAEMQILMDHLSGNGPGAKKKINTDTWK